jgi:ATP-dependent DNA helicase
LVRLEADDESVSSSSHRILRFDLPTMQTTLSSERSAQLIHTLHAILKPFLLRRLKVDVEVGLPPKKEYLLYAPLTVRQKELYDAIVTGGLRRLLIKSGEGDQKEKKEDLAIEPAACDGKRILRVGRRSFGNVDDDDDDAWLERAANGETHYQEIRKQKLEKDAEDIGRDHQYKAAREFPPRRLYRLPRSSIVARCAVKKVNNMKLQNTVMQLRKVCSHPFLFDWPLDAQTRQPVVNEELVNVSGKMMVLERLLEELFRRGHKVLLFSQFTTMLDIIEVRVLGRFLFL